MAAAMGAGLLVSGRAGTWRGRPGERPGRGQEAGGEWRRALREGAVLGPHASRRGLRGLRGLRGRVPARRGASWRSFPAAAAAPLLSGFHGLSLLGGPVAFVFLNLLGTGRDRQEEPCPVLVSVVRGSVFPRHGCPTVPQAVVLPW